MFQTTSRGDQEVEASWTKEGKVLTGLRESLLNAAYYSTTLGGLLTAGLDVNATRDATVSEIRRLLQEGCIEEEEE